MTEPDGIRYAIAADLLDAARPLHHLSLMFSAIATVLLCTRIAPPFALTSLAAGMLAAIYAIRIRFDAALFHRLACGLDPAAFDAAMTDLALMPSAKAGRPAHLRIAGAKRLLKVQVAAVLAQVACLVVASIALAVNG